MICNASRSATFRALSAHRASLRGFHFVRSSIPHFHRRSFTAAQEAQSQQQQQQPNQEEVLQEEADCLLSFCNSCFKLRDDFFSVCALFFFCFVCVARSRWRKWVRPILGWGGLTIGVTGFCYFVYYKRGLTILSRIPSPS